MEIITLEDAEQRILVWPEAGGNILSWVYKPLNWELAFQLNSLKSYRPPELQLGFAGCNAAGFDDLVFTTDACTWQAPDPESPILQLPDHGDVWFRPVQYAKRTTIDDHPAMDTQVKITGEAGVRYQFSRQIVLGPKAQLDILYEIVNESHTTLPFYLAWHPLFALTCPVTVGWNSEHPLVLTQPWFEHRRQRLWPAGTQFSYHELQQLHGLSYDPNQPTDPPDTLKGFIGAPPDAIGLHLTHSLPNTNQRLRIAFIEPPVRQMPIQPTNELPIRSVGLWFNRRGFRNEANLALEPCTFWGDTPNAQPPTPLKLPLVQPARTGFTRFACQLSVISPDA
jgi:galactose mutarotase-like enzyme